MKVFQPFSIVITHKYKYISKLMLHRTLLQESSPFQLQLQI